MKLDPDLELIALERPRSLASLAFSFLSIFWGIKKKQLPRLSSHNCRVKTRVDRPLWAGAHAARVQVILQTFRHCLVRQKSSMYTMP